MVFFSSMVIGDLIKYSRCALGSILFLRFSARAFFGRATCWLNYLNWLLEDGYVI